MHNKRENLTVCAFVCVSVCERVYMRVCVYMCVCVRACIHMMQSHNTHNPKHLSTVSWRGFLIMKLKYQFWMLQTMQ